MTIRVYTWRTEPFALGGLGRHIAANLEEYERVDIGKGYYGIVFPNRGRDCWHLALENCGALVQSGYDRNQVIALAKADIKLANPKVLRDQISRGRQDQQDAELIKLEEFLKYLPSTPNKEN